MGGIELSKSPFPWKRNFVKVPQEVIVKAQGITAPYCRVAATKLISVADVKAGLYRHLEIRHEGGRLSFEPTVAPPKSSGRWSKTNVDGREDKQKHLPKVPKLYTFEVPNFGDWSKGSHTITQERMVYPRKYVPPKHLAIEIELLEEAPDAYLFKFVVGEVLALDAADFEQDLLYNLNLLQENVGVSDVFPSDATKEDYWRAISVSWEFLPPGERDPLGAMLRRNPDLPQEQVQVIEDRYEFLKSLHPITYIMGSSGFQRYYGAMISENLVVFENIRYGNAVYIMSDGWEVNSRLSRTELLAKAQRDFIRVRHYAGWKDLVRHHVATLRAEQEIRQAAPGEEGKPK
jgi:hypothetical protein